jgi:hypothetical protein
LVAHDRIENLGATPGDRTKSGFAQEFPAYLESAS